MQGWKIFFKGERLALAGASGLPKFERRCRLAVLFTAGHLQLHETQGIGREALRPCWRTRRAFLPRKGVAPLVSRKAWPGPAVPRVWCVRREPRKPWRVKRATAATTPSVCEIAAPRDLKQALHKLPQSGTVGL